MCHKEHLGEVADQEFKNIFCKNVLKKFYSFDEILSAFLWRIIYSVCIFGKWTLYFFENEARAASAS